MVAVRRVDEEDLTQGRRPRPARGAATAASINSTVSVAESRQCSERLARAASAAGRPAGSLFPTSSFQEWGKEAVEEAKALLLLLLPWTMTSDRWDGRYCPPLVTGGGREGEKEGRRK